MPCPLARCHALSLKRVALLICATNPNNLSRGQESESAMGKQLMTFHVNGETSQVAASPTKTLLEVLREELDLTGTKHGCELGHCGACTVLLDGEPVLSCLLLAVEAQDQAITTIEGLAHDNTLHPLQWAFAE